MLKVTSIAKKVTNNVTKKKAVKRLPNLEFKGLKLSQGNSKLQSNEEINFIVWNILAIVTCPFSTVNCRKYCYARKTEKMYKNTLVRNESNYFLSQQDNFISNMIEFISKILALKKNQNRITYFRIHESGDFYSQKYFNDFVSIANHFKGNKNIVFQAYTKSIEYIDNYINCNMGKLESINIHFTSSIWNDTDTKNIELTNKLNLQTYEAFPKKELAYKVNNEGYFKCECIDCGKCGECYKNTNKKIAVEIH